MAPRIPPDQLTVADLTPRQLAVAYQIAHRQPVKRIAALLGITDRRVRMLVTSIAFRTGCQPDEDEKVHVALWYRAQVPIYVEHFGAIPIRNLGELRRVS